MEPPKTQYARSADDTHIAYEVFGQGPDLLLAWPWISHLELMWEMPEVESWLRSLARSARVIAMDQRGVGLSDRMTQIIDLETKVDDVRAVLEAAGSQRAVLYGQGLDGGAICSMFAAMYPERTAGLLLWTGQASGVRDADYPWAPTQTETEEFRELIAKTWGDEDLIEPLLAAAGAPTAAADPAGRRRWARLLRYAASRGDALVHERVFDETDYRRILAAIHVPTTILQPGDDLAEAEWVASQIPGAKLVRLPGSPDFPPESSHPELNIEAARAFIAALRAEEEDFDRVLATVLFTDIVDSTATIAAIGDRAWRDVVERHHAIVRGSLDRFHGTEVDTAGDGFFATFDGPARAVRCAEHIVEAVQPLGLRVRAGVHTGECETIDGKLGGLGVVIGARVGSKAQPGSILVSQTVKDLTAGSGLAFEPAGEHELKGVPDLWRLYRVVTG
ncbi:MAG TPA: adenylate/guanylate cyclase domain-containing protein [Actinomycetota bacterium]|nr:adenylate/guanylate cyclase domain-containing protein [Actinomycetota bacterium]